jgi:hypothetical protein
LHPAKGILMAVEAPGANPAVTGAIRHASRVTGTNFQYLVATAQVESRFNPGAAAPTSSARGLFQLIEQTWLATLKEQGPALGYGDVANAIERTASGQYAVTDPRLNNRIMNLRSDPTANAVMAGAYTKTNASQLAGRLGRSPTEGELYVAHFLGSNGASRLISLAESAPGVRADRAFPTPAKANPSIFYDKGRPRSVAEVYRVLVNRYAIARREPAAPAPTRVAAVEPPQPAAALRPMFAPDSAELTDAYAAAARMSELSREIADAAPVFHGLFRTSARREAVAPVVSALWSAPTPVTEPVTQETAQQATAPPPKSAETFSLFQDQPTDARALFRGKV